jgi:hypothetical protein
VEREEEWENVVGQALGETIKRMESMRRKWGRHDPLVVLLVESLVDRVVVKAAMDEVDKTVGKEQEEWKLEEIVPGRHIAQAEVEPGVATNFGEEEWRSEDCHDWEGLHRADNLLSDLVFQELWMVERPLVEDEDVRENGAQEVEQDTKQPGYRKRPNCDAVLKPTYQVIKNNENICRRQSLRESTERSA